MGKKKSYFQQCLEEAIEAEETVENAENAEVSEPEKNEVETACREMRVIGCIMLNVREFPDMKAKVVDQLHKDQIVKLISEHNGYSRIYTPELLEGFVKSEFLKEV